MGSVERSFLRFPHAPTGFTPLVMSLLIVGVRGLLSTAQLLLPFLAAAGEFCHLFRAGTYRSSGGYRILRGVREVSRMEDKAANPARPHLDRTAGRPPFSMQRGVGWGTVTLCIGIWVGEPFDLGAEGGEGLS